MPLASISTMLQVLRNCDVYAPESLGVTDVLVAGNRIAAIGAELDVRGELVEERDLEGAPLIPGLIDAHVHVTGGGGESGPASRVPPLGLSALAGAGITCVVGVLGTDGTTRTPRDLVARTLGLREEGLSAHCYTGSYELPVRTITGSVRDDIVFVDPILGVGELAVSDHRSSQPTFDELLRVAADAHVAGMMSGKAGVLHLHMGDGARGLDLVRRALAETELPASVFHPTHVNRRPELLEEARALSGRGCTVDVTAFPVDPEDPSDRAIDAASAIASWLSKGVDPTRITCSSDGGGCMPVFDHDGRLTRMGVGAPGMLAETLRSLLERGLDLAAALPPFTSNVARVLRLQRKGRIARGADADLVVLGEDGAPRDVLARGRWLVRGGESLVRGPFEASAGAVEANR